MTTRSLHKTLVNFPLKVQHVSASQKGLGDHAVNQLNILFDLVFAGVNGNGDEFTEEELRASYHTLVNQPIDWEHDEPNIGVITEAHLVEAKGNTPLHVTCKGTIWAWRYPEYTDLITASAQLAELGYGEAAEYATSMECYFHDADYIIGDGEQVIPMSEDTGELDALRGRSLGGKLVSRRLKGVIFGGAGVTANPGEKKALFKAAASNRSAATGKELFTDLEASEFALPSLRMFPIDKREHVAASLEYFEKLLDTVRESVEFSQIAEAHERIIHAANSFGLTTDGHRCAACVSESGNETTDKEESEANMSDKENVNTSEEVVVDENLEAEADLETSDTTSEEVSGDETAEASDDSQEEAAETEAADDRLDRIITMLSQLVPSESAATEEVDENETEASEEGVDELQRALDKIEELGTKLAESEAAFTGLKRFTELKDSGITVDPKKAEAKQAFLAGLSNEAWATYLEDLKEAKASADTRGEDSDEVHEANASLDLETDPVSDKAAEYRNFWKKSDLF